MFYSHEVLTSRKYGVATVWLVATLGSSSKLKKIKRKAIREVDVPKACRTILDPGAPMALRLQGSLLYGVSRVYLEQCSYVLSDAENAHNSMRLMMKIMKNAAIDPEAGRARPEQLILPDDPAFLPDFTLPPADLLVELNFPIPPPVQRFDESQTYTPGGSQSSHRSPTAPLGNLLIPSSSPVAAGDFQIAGDYGIGSVGESGGLMGVEDVAQPLEEDFSFDADGNLIDFAAGEGGFSTPLNQRGSTMMSDAGASARVREEHLEGQQTAAERVGDQMELDFPNIGEDFPMDDAAAISPDQQQQSSSRVQSDGTFPSSASAPMQRRTRKPKVIPADRTMELRNKDLANWNNNYLHNMAEATRLKNAHRAPAQAKKNAEYFVWGAGVGGIGRRPAGATAPSPLDMYCGDNLFALFTGIDRRALRAGKKHDRDSGIDEAMAEEGRRVRPRRSVEDNQQQVGRGQEDEGIILAEDDELAIADKDDVELPRSAPSALDDQQIFSSMPWNMSASVRGSSAVPHSARVGSVGTSTGVLGSARLRGSRMVSASPLQRRALMRGSAADLEALGLGGLGSELDVEGFGLPEQMTSDGFGEMLLASPGKGDGGSPERVRVQEALSAEGSNFLEFINDALFEKQQRVREMQGTEDETEQADEVLFEEVLPPAKNSRVVACQGLMMVLALGSKGLLEVRQDEPFAEIGLKVTEKAKEMGLGVVFQPEGEGDAGEGGADAGEDAEMLKEEGQFDEEQVAAGAGDAAGAPKHDVHGSDNDSASEDNGGENEVIEISDGGDDDDDDGHGSNNGNDNDSLYAD
ncbi:uncharacterized protein EI97DRAFT_436495 [Westerdykella ornata]|uniref:Rad21/Rec8-like protein N-terminal domain-containing protein n=1 Tax=Westerdykella ornata TaxID=318751 RepID=A0A6A6J964_WESOR|nr:uncharacterized protein EI97DRAFT_436495 [Westerdykella ornata]KAF2272885.1 hypothetical protein EI97DRAFT_436495 [Westerdykella ornata]